MHAHMQMHFIFSGGKPEVRYCIWTTSIEEHLQEWPKKLSLVIAS